LRCPWCHNPESQLLQPEILVFPDKCKKCGACSAACSLGAVENAFINRSKCTACGECVKLCKNGALKIAGKRYTTDEAVNEAIQDKTFFETSGGGVTLSGGESLTQPGFVLEILKNLKKMGVNTCIETCGICSEGFIKKLTPYVDHWLYDVKLIDEKAHQAILGVPLTDVITGLYILKEAQADITLRCPIIPGINDNDHHFNAIRKLADDVGVTAVDILPYHRLGRDKYIQLGRETPDNITAPDVATIETWERKITIENNGESYAK